jgi:hypothetical protein
MYEAARDSSVNLGQDADPFHYSSLRHHWLYIIACMMVCMTIEAQPWQPQLNSCTQHVDKVFLLLKKVIVTRNKLLRMLWGGNIPSFKDFFC